jgi:hypothetical protein
MKSENLRLTEAYIKAYNSMDVDGMLNTLHTGIKFRNFSGGKETVSSEGKDAFRKTAEEAVKFFRMREQKIVDLSADDDILEILVDFYGVLATDMPGGQKAGEKIMLEGRSVFTFRDGKIYSIDDYDSPEAL